MKMLIKSISTLLAVLMMLGSMTAFSVFAVGAEEETGDTPALETGKDPTTVDYTTEVFKTPEEALKYMVLYDENENLQLYVNEYTGVFALVHKKTGQITFSNPYDVASSQGSEATKSECLSQIILKYTDNGKSKQMNSYKDAALNGQITVKRIKGGVRVEYIIGNEATKKLVPRLISEKNFTEMLLTPLENAVSEFLFNRFTKFYDEQNIANARSEAERQTILKRYPKAADMVLYSLAPEATAQDLNFLEELIKGYCPDYTFDQMDADHEETGYEATNEISPVFKLALEYTLNEDGLTVRQPTNGLRFNTTMYSVESLDILPYFGAGNSYNEGYTFYPDGSGALFYFQDLAGKTTYRVKSKVYGSDYAYHTIDGTYQKALRMPVYGIQSDDAYFVYTIAADETDSETETTKSVETTYKISVTVVHTEEDLLKQIEADIAAGVYGENAELVSKIEKVTESRGFLAIIEEGESLCELSSYHAGSYSDYHTIMSYFNPRPKDSYDLEGIVSATSSNSTITVISDRKYTGNLKIRYVLLSDDELSEKDGFKNSGNYYSADYVGMANAYSAYLVARGQFEPLTADDVTDDIPLYVESFGALEVTEQIMSFPVNVMKPLTTFEDIQVMYDELSKEGVKNINFRLTGFANGGMYSVVPTKLKWEKAVGGKKGMNELLQYADNINANTDGHLGLYPEFDLLYVNNTSMFDGVKMKRDIIRTIDNRYASRQEYSATQQKYISYFVLALSPAYIDRFYNKLLNAYDAYSEYGSLGISVSTLGTDLSTDFDEDEPYNREDNKRFLKDALAAISSKQGISGVMSDGGNAYTFGYVDHLLNVALDSSRFTKASRSIPFAGLVLHGYVQFAGTPINMEGNINYAMLKAIENGASLYFLLSYRNVNILKEDTFLSENYSVNYNIWKQDVIKYYNELNAVLHDVQTSQIIRHDFINGTRVLNADEIKAMIRDTMDANDAYEQAFEQTAQMEHLSEIVAARAAAKRAVATMKETLAQIQTDIESLAKINDELLEKSKACDEAKKTYDDYLLNPKAKEALVEKYLKELERACNTLRNAAAKGIQMIVDARYAYESAVELHQMAAKAVVLLTEEGAAQELIDDAAACAAEAETYLKDILALADQCDTYTEDIYKLVSTYVDKATVDSQVDFHEDDEQQEAGQETAAVAQNSSDIVAVTYGGKNGDANAPYKTFILNYNNYAVTLTYDVDGEARVYTIPANRYVMIVH